MTCKTMTEKVLDVSNAITDMFAGTCTVTSEGSNVYLVDCGTTEHNLYTYSSVKVSNNPDKTVTVQDVVTLYKSDNTFRHQFKVYERVSAYQFRIKNTVAVPYSPTAITIPTGVNRFKGTTGHVSLRFTKEFENQGENTLTQLSEYPVHVIIEGEYYANNARVDAGGNIVTNGINVIADFFERLNNHYESADQSDNSIAEIKARYALSKRVQLIMGKLRITNWQNWGMVYGFSNEKETIRQRVIFNINSNSLLL